MTKPLLQTSLADERNGHDNGTDVEFDNTKMTHFFRLD